MDPIVNGEQLFTHPAFIEFLSPRLTRTGIIYPRSPREKRANEKYLFLFNN